MRFDPDHTGIRELGRSPGMVRAMQHLADKMRAEAQRIAPVDTGRYKASMLATSGVRGGRAYGRLSNDARNPHSGFPYCVALEFGNSRVRAYRVLQRSIDAIRH